MKLTLDNGRTISLSHLEQWTTYGGLLCGKPYKEINDSHISRALEEAASKYPAFGKPFLIEPRRTFIPGNVQRDLPPGERIPGVTCIAEFGSGELKKPGSEAFSFLVIVWFQDEFALPIDTGVESAIEQTDWENLAADWMM
jgi:hypothetical protein